MADKSYVVASQGVIPNITGGGFSALLPQGAPLPSDIDAKQLAMLIETGQVVEGGAVGGLAPVVRGDGSEVLTHPVDVDAANEALGIGLSLQTKAGSEADDVDGDGPIPPKSAPKAEWVAYAASQGADEAEAESMTKDDLIAAYGAA